MNEGINVEQVVFLLCAIRTERDRAEPAETSNKEN